VTTQAQWDALHRDPRFRPRYPAEAVVRFRFTQFPREDVAHLHVLDVGIGGGRHAYFFAAEGFRVSGVDFSAESVAHARRWLESAGLHADLRAADMRALPFPDAHFDAVVAIASLYYTDEAGVRAGIAEIHRVLKPRGKALVLVRTVDDCRFGKGRAAGRNTFVLDTPETNEAGMTMFFFAEDDVRAFFATFSSVVVDRNDFTLGGGAIANSDWIVTLEK
jgi:SAM-dependent methyltransferase